jgi:hypothetical protein
MIQTVTEGHINVHLPQKFWGQQVEIIILSTSIKETHVFPQKSFRGCLHQYANSALIEREHEAWQEAIREKHDHY